MDIVIDIQNHHSLSTIFFLIRMFYIIDQTLTIQIKKYILKTDSSVLSQQLVLIFIPVYQFHETNLCHCVRFGNRIVIN